MPIFSSNGKVQFREPAAGAAWRPLSPEERRVFDRWAVAVAAFYSVIVSGLLVAIFVFPTVSGVEKAWSPVGNLASQRVVPGDRHP